MLEEAKKKSEELERDVVGRQKALQLEAKMLEGRKQQVLESLRDLAAQIQDALLEPTSNAPETEELIDALNVERQR
jgi:hypothetical protein